MGNYKILQAKIEDMRIDLSELKERYYEVKAPISLNSFDCAKCGAHLQITSRDEKFIICEYGNTPFLMTFKLNRYLITYYIIYCLQNKYYAVGHIFFNSSLVDSQFLLFIIAFKALL